MRNTSGGSPHYLVGTVFVAFFIALLPIASAAHVDDEVHDDLLRDGVARVEVVVNEESPPEQLQTTSTDSLLMRKDKELLWLNSQRDRVLRNLRVSTGETITFGSSSDFNLEYKRGSSAGFSGTITAVGLNILTQDPHVKGVYKKHTYQTLLAQSVPLINANDVWDYRVGNERINGTGQVVCVVDTGVDYTHPNLGGCSSVGQQVIRVANGTIENVLPARETEHPYLNSHTYSFQISRPGWQKISVHFSDFATETGYDYVKLYDAGNNLVATYHGSLGDFWSQTVPGSVVNVQMITDTYVNDYGFRIDQITNSVQETVSGGCSKVIGGYDFVGNDNDPQDTNGHGTHCAGIIAGTHPTYRGVAPGAKIVAVRICGSSDCPYVEEGLDWCATHAEEFNISVISMSVGGNHHYGYCDSQYPAMAASINAATAKNISVVIATGNNGWVDAIASPACVQNAVSVGATSKSDIVASYSNVASIMTVFAPGSDIVSLRSSAMSGCLCQGCSGALMTCSGTSMATPTVAGAVALLQNYWTKTYGRDLTVNEVKDKLKTRGPQIHDNRPMGTVTARRVDVLADITNLSLVFTQNSIPDGGSASGSAYFAVQSNLPLASATLAFSPIGGGTPTNVTLTKTSASVFEGTVALLSGRYEYKCYGYDAAGQQVQTITRQVVFQNTPISVIIMQPRDGAHYRNNFTMLVLIAAQNLRVSFYNISNATHHVLQSNITKNINANQFKWNATVDVGVLREGKHVFFAFANDSDNNHASNVSEFFVDTTSPEILETNHTAVQAGGNASFSMKATDTNLNITGAMFECNNSGRWTNVTMLYDTMYDEFNATISNLSRGRKLYYRYHASDIAGNTNSTIVNTIDVENSPPNPTILQPQYGATLEVGAIATFEGTVSNLDLDPLTTQWLFADLVYPVPGMRVNHTFMTPGTYLVHFNVCDPYTCRNASVVVTAADTGAPVIQDIDFLSILHNESDINQAVFVSIFDYSGIANVTMNITKDSYLPSVCTALEQGKRHNCTWTYGGFPSIGVKAFRIQAYEALDPDHVLVFQGSFLVTSCNDGEQNGDEEGVDCGGSCNVNCQDLPGDHTAPTIQISTPRSGSVYKNSYQMSATVSDPFLESTTYSVRRGSTLIQTGSINPTTTTYTWRDSINVSTAVYSDGNYNLIFYANDTAGNFETANVEFTVDKTTPTITHIERTPMVVFPGSTVTIRANVTDASRNSSRIILRSNHTGQWQNQSMSLSGLRYTSEISSQYVTQSKTIAYSINAWDEAWNYAQSASQQFTVDQNPIYTLDIKRPNNGEVLEAGEDNDFDGQVVDVEDDDQFDYVWEFGDGTTSGLKDPVKRYERVGHYTVELNLSGGQRTIPDTATVYVNDTLAPTVEDISYDHDVHLPDETWQHVNITLHDYSRVANVVITVLHGSNLSGDCYQYNETKKCSWKWTNLTYPQTSSFQIGAVDNSSGQHVMLRTYIFSITSCTDGRKNGDETGVDCGGHCGSCPSGGGSGGGGSGGGGSGGGGDDPLRNNTYEFMVSDARACFTRYNVTVKGSLGPNTLTTQLGQLPIGTSPPEGQIYQYVSVSTTGIAADKIAKLSVHFKVNKEWLRGNNLDKNTVTLRRLSGTWTELPTEIIGEGLSSVYYVAQSPGFSVFAITARPLPVPDTENPAYIPTPSLPPEIPLTDEGLDPIDILLSSVVMLLIAGVLVYIVYHLFGNEGKKNSGIMALLKDQKRSGLEQQIDRLKTLADVDRSHAQPPSILPPTVTSPIKKPAQGILSGLLQKKMNILEEIAQLRDQGLDDVQIKISLLRNGHDPSEIEKFV